AGLLDAIRLAAFDRGRAAPLPRPRVRAVHRVGRGDSGLCAVEELHAVGVAARVPGLADAGAAALGPGALAAVAGVVVAADAHAGGARVLAHRRDAHLVWVGPRALHAARAAVVDALRRVDAHVGAARKRIVGARHARAACRSGGRHVA